MAKDNPISLRNRLDALAQTPPAGGAEFWFARDLQKPLGYTRRDTFMTVLGLAIEACKTTGRDAGYHFRGITKTVTNAKGVSSPVEDFKLTRAACHLIAMNGDPSKEPIAFARIYFAEPPRKATPVKKPKLEKPPAVAAPSHPVRAKVASAPVIDGSTPTDPKPRIHKNPTPGSPPKVHGKPVGNTGSRFIPQSGGGHHQKSRNARWDDNMAVGRGHPNTAARNSR